MGVCGTDGDHFHLKAIRRDHAPGCALRIVIVQAEHAEPLDTGKQEPRHARLGPVTARQEHVAPHGLVALLRQIADGQERRPSGGRGGFGRGHGGRDTPNFCFSFF